MNLGSRIRRYREQHRLTQKDLGLRVHKSSQVISNWERGYTADIRSEDLKLLAVALSTTVEDLLGRVSSPTDSISQSEDEETPVLPTGAIHRGDGMPTNSQEQGFLIRIPIIGTIKAGPDGLAFDDPQGYETLDSDLLPPGVKSRWLQVRGDSMAPYLLPGDLVLFHENYDVPNNSLVVVIIDGEEGTVKRIKRGNNFIRLEAENPYYPPREFRDRELLNVRIVGPVTRILRVPKTKNGNGVHETGAGYK